MKKANKILSLISITAMSVVIFTSLCIPVKAADADIYLLNDLSKPAYTRSETANFAHQKKIGLHSENYGYELTGKIYKFDDLTSVFMSHNNDIALARAALVIEKTAFAVIPGQTTDLKIESIAAINATTVKVKFNKLMDDYYKKGLNYTFGGVAVPASKVVYSGITATLNGLTLVSTVDGKTPSYEVLVKVGTTQLSKQSIVWDKIATQNLLINKVVAIPDIFVVQNALPVLPNIIDVLYKNGSTGKEYVTWGSCSTSTVGLKKATGTIDGSTVKASINVNVTAIEYVNIISMDYYSYIGAYSANIRTDSIVAKVSLNGVYMYYIGNNNFQLYTVLTKGSTATFNVYDVAGKLLGTKKYLVQQ
ncbi:Ig-like domain-containing protein [Clostridium sp.]|uniref:Ig-like domain-containing protein n=1 Tax=Clostridium sp. TaxID=1506 RepID=UPI003D6CEFAE